ncbi:hypothetical protein BD626DRAFT_474034 [Schizophyllum amplum]|uniref:Uncharacterized protein n=1 Tax=Schizophyllum amplum TaxID=97359 RepID=A0A550CXB1_9AGAR|nr:hypothetical protein BD626DRAFT_474034 [Auriculariopsis ampla]
MTHIDATALAALIVSLVALVVTLLQVVQQYASTAYDYRRCSKRVLGQWAQRTRRHFIFSEVRFEVTFSTPHLSIFFPRDYRTLKRRPTQMSTEQTSLTSTDKRAHTSIDTQDIRIPVAPKQFVYEADRPSFSSWPPTPHKEIQQYDITDQPWFLNFQDPSVSEARCGWLSVLAAAAASDVGLYVKERRWSYDYMPQSLTRPIASADRASFLSLMSLRRVPWRNAGADEVFVGSGPTCEVRINDIQSFGPVYVAEMSSKLDISTRYQCVSDTARRAMFNEFDLGFGMVHTDADIGISLRKSFRGTDTNFARGIQDWYEGDHWCIGVGLLIACWCTEPSMPKAINGDTFRSVYSAQTLTTGLDHVRTLQMLCGSACVHDLRKGKSAIRDFLPLVDDFYKETVHSQLIVPHLLQACSLSHCGEYIHQGDTSWTTANACLDGIHILDDQLNTLLSQIPWETDDFRRLIAYWQIRHAMSEYPVAEGLANEAGTLWVQELDVVIAADALAVVNDLIGELSKNEVDSSGLQYQSVIHKVVVNRLLRGALWRVHNSNGPSKHDVRTALECTLSHKVLADKTTVYLA